MSSELRKQGSTSVVQTSNIGFTSEVSDYLVVHTGPGVFIAAQADTLTMFIVVRRCTIFTPPRRQASSDFEGLKVCEKKRSGKKKACTKEKYR